MMYDNELKHYGVLGMKWGIRRARKTGKTYTYKSLSTRSHSRKAKSLSSKVNKLKTKISKSSSENGPVKTDKLNKKLATLNKKLQRENNRAKNSAEHDRMSQTLAGKMTAGEALVGALLVGTYNLKYFNSVKASRGDRDGIGTAARLVVANVIAGPLGAGIYGAHKKSKYIRKDG